MHGALTAKAPKGIEVRVPKRTTVPRGSRTDVPVDGIHPQRDDEEFKAANADRDIREYQRYLHGQVRELLRPLLEKMQDRRGGGAGGAVLGAVGGKVTGVELGML
ncbi:hypothetical protein PUR49_00265, partial [Streptomyces sp. BE147]|nr:hypothetical protein [Streptomyces sp. BE147]